MAPDAALQQTLANAAYNVDLASAHDIAALRVIMVICKAQPSLSAWFSWITQTACRRHSHTAGRYQSQCGWRAASQLQCIQLS